MRNINTNIKTELNEELIFYIKIITLTLKSGIKIGFSEYDLAFILDNILYKPQNSFNLENFSNRNNSTNFSEILGVIDDEIITENDLISGKFLDSEIEIAVTNPKNLALGKVILFTGFVDKIINDNQKFYFEIKSFSEKLKRTITQNYSKKCRAVFTDSKCGLNKNTFTFNGSITSVLNDYQFADSARTQANFYFNYGVIKFTSGLNNGLSFDVKNYQDKIFEIFLATEFQPNIGDTYEVTTGCDKEFKTCITKFNNAINFRGEPFVPGNERLLRGF
jgi:uncharacterized phage protein (TIGR02218 family)